ncbi:leucine-rich repeat domain-containing protein [Treponema phagedenis]|uniref:leucine-rich repeat domain-containing protein n=1 Tax=Treponema phagedenis TaxID=162 RepID=UPI0015A3A188|nr:leucine-rich repeat domain-containing protein [Treponema phagedenis]NVP23095.1 leucine-rich repeat domain-containing protein [Treponema phagedenis]QLC57963.1 leucine-rich repeat domain-containing protein [Treponema phagedenis]
MSTEFNNEIKMRTTAILVGFRVTTKDGSPCEVWNGGKKIAELQSDNWENIAVPNNAEEIIIKGYDIQELYCCGSKLTALDISGLTSLKELYCNNNQLTSLAVSGLTSLQWLDCSDNQLTELDVNGCTSLQELYCNNNKLSAEVFKKLFEDFPERKWNYGIKREQPQKRGNI